MDILNLDIENYCGHSKSSIDLENVSIAVIIGKSKGNAKISNAVGKSTIFSAIKYVLFNEVDFSSLDKAIRNGTDACKVSIDFKSLDFYFRIIRSKSKKSGTDVRLFKKSTKEEEWQDITQRRSTDTEKEIFKIIKINYKTFCNSFLFAQTDLSGLGSLTPEKRKASLKEALQLNVYSKYEAAAKKQLNEILKEIDISNALINSIGNPKEEIIDLIKELDVSSFLSVKKSEALKFKHQDLNALKIKHEGLSVIKQNQDRKTGLINDLNKIHTEIISLESKVDKLKEAGISLQEFIKSSKLELNNLKNNDVDKVKLIEEEISKNSNLLIDKKSALKSSLSELQKLNSPLPNEGVCENCRQQVSKASLEECKIKIKKDVEKQNENILTIKSEISVIEKNNSDLSKELSNYSKIINEINQKNNLINSKNQEFQNTKSTFVEYAKLLESTKKQWSDKRQEIDAIGIVDDTEFFNVKKLIDNTIHEINNMSEELSKLNNSIAVMQHKKKDKENNIEKLEKLQNSNIEAIEKSVVLNKVVEAFGSTGIPALITHTVLDDFQFETNHFLESFFPGMQVKFVIEKDNKGNIQDTLDLIFIYNGNDLEYNQLSGAQKFTASLALRLGLASTMRKKLGTDIKFLLIDEVDQCLDEMNLEFFEDTIKKIQNDFKILIITHNNDLKSKFNTAILVEQDENMVSQASIVRSW